MRLLTWNVCFGCMYSNDKSKIDRTAQKLALHCEKLNKEQSNNVCLTNVVKVLGDEVYDFICLQEAANYELIYGALNAKKNYYHFVHSGSIIPSGYAEIVTFYQKDTYIPKYGCFADLASVTKGRPIQIIFFERKSDGHTIILINLHNKHHSDMKDLERGISNVLYKFTAFLQGKKLIRQEENLNPYDSKNGIFEKYINNLQNFSVIALGDFNDHGNGNFWKGLCPFKYVVWTTNQSIKNVILGTHNNLIPPNTCCVGLDRLRDHINVDRMYGDYILTEQNKYSGTMNYPKIWGEYYQAMKYPTSDHVPVKIEIHPHSLKPVIEKSLSPQIKYLKLKESKIIRLQNDVSDPQAHESINNNFFRGEIIEKSSKLIYPNGEIGINGLVFVVDKYNPNVIGYIRRQYLNRIPMDGVYNLDTTQKSKVTLRLRDDLRDPNVYKKIDGKPHKGLDIDGSNDLIFPNGMITNNGLIIVQDVHDRNKIGYVRKAVIEPYLIGGSEYIINKEKYIKLK